MFDLHNFTFAQMIRVGAHLRRLGSGATSMEDAANRIVNYFHEQLVCNNGHDRACVLVRLFKTHPYGDLDDELRRSATKMLNGAAPSPSMKCLVLMATAGEKPEWNSRFTSGGHKAIPLVNETVVQQSPMISQLLLQLGLSFSTLHADASLLVDSKQSAFNVFHVPEAAGSPYVPAQEDFVIAYGVKSALGFGGLLPTGDLFAVILFSRVSIPRQSAELFKTLALSAKLALVPFAGDRVFAEEIAEAAGGPLCR